MQYLVTWKIDMEADSPAEAAAKALIVQRDNDPANSATVFEVCEEHGENPVIVDLSDEIERPDYELNHPWRG